MKILDLSAGNRAIWFAPNYPEAVFLDIRPEVEPDIVCDTRALPDEVGEGYSLVVFDPPHKNTQGGNCGENYGHWNMNHVRDTIARMQAAPPRKNRRMRTMIDDTDIDGRPYAKLSQLKASETVEVDAGFTCIAPGVLCTVFGEGGGLFLQCADGEHMLDGQLASDGDTLIGVYHRKDLSPAPSPGGSREE